MIVIIQLHFQNANCLYLKKNSGIEVEVQTELDLVTEDKISQDSGLEIEGFSSNVIYYF